MSRLALRDPRLWLLAGALAMALAALLVPRITLTRDAYDVLAVIDITTSMNARDVDDQGKPESRLAASKTALQNMLLKMPCQSRLGLGIFTERQSFLLFDPVEVCANYAAIEDAIQTIEWRMAWAGDSYVTKGVYSAIDMAKSLDADLVFFTDGHEMPPLSYSGLPPFEGERGEVAGLVVGVGSHTHTPLLKYDDQGREVGTYDEQEVPQENRQGPPPPDAESRPGYHPKWAPFGNEVVNTNQHMAFVREPHLKEIAAATGLTYAHLDSAQTELLPPFAAIAHPRALEVASDVRAIPGSMALALLAILYVFSAGADLRARRDPSSISSTSA
jgi:mxaL protein